MRASLSPVARCARTSNSSLAFGHRAKAKFTTSEKPLSRDDLVRVDQMLRLLGENTTDVWATIGKTLPFSRSGNFVRAQWMASSMQSNKRPVASTDESHDTDAEKNETASFASSPPVVAPVVGLPPKKRCMVVSNESSEACTNGGDARCDIYNFECTEKLPKGAADALRPVVRFVLAGTFRDSLHASAAAALSRSHSIRPA